MDFYEKRLQSLQKQLKKWETNKDEIINYVNETNKMMEDFINNATTFFFKEIASNDILVIKSSYVEYKEDTCIYLKYGYNPRFETADKIAKKIMQRHTGLKVNCVCEMSANSTQFFVRMFVD